MKCARTGRAGQIHQGGVRSLGQSSVPLFYEGDDFPSGNFQTNHLTHLAYDLDPGPSSSFLATVLFSLKSLLEGRLQSRNLELSCNFISIQCSKLNLLIQFLLSAAAMLFHNDCPAASNTIFTDKLKIKCYH